jgi:hypothetical protein
MRTSAQPRRTGGRKPAGREEVAGGTPTYTSKKLKIDLGAPPPLQASNLNSARGRQTGTTPNRDVGKNPGGDMTND